MSEYTALQKHSCPACGAQAEWNPGKQALVCSYCGTVSPYELEQDSGSVREIDLVKTLREMPEELRGWKTERKTVRCQSCRAVSVFDPERVGQNCDFCGSPELVDYEEIKAPIRPQSQLPFKISQVQVRDSLRDWFRSKWFAPGKLKSRALVDTVRGIYLPYWTFDSRVFCRWSAESGYYYYVNETFRDSDGRLKTRRVRRTRWQASSGSLKHFFDDEPVPGSQGVPTDLLRQVEPFPTHELLPYDTGYLSGFVVEHYQIVLIEASRAAQEQMNQKLYQLCGREVPGDTFRNLRIEPDHSDQTFKHILVPVWYLSYDFSGRSYKVLVNGYTGKIAGEYPKSIWKILLVIMIVVMIALVFILLSN